MSSPIFGAAAQAASLREPSMLIGLVMEVTAADRIEIGLLTWAVVSTAAPRATHNARKAGRANRSMDVLRLGTGYESCFGSATPNRSAQGLNAGKMVS